MIALDVSRSMELGTSHYSKKEAMTFITGSLLFLGFFIVLPLAYWSMAPGMELDGVMSWVPVTNALLLQQRLMAVRSDSFPWQHIPAVVISLTACVALALWAAVRQFHRESVLFREAEASGGGWSLFGKKE